MQFGSIPSHRSHQIRGVWHGQRGFIAQMEEFEVLRLSFVRRVCFMPLLQNAIPEDDLAGTRARDLQVITFRVRKCA